MCAAIRGNNLPILTIIFAFTPVNSLGRTICSGLFEKPEWSLLLNQWTLNKFKGSIESLSTDCSLSLILSSIESGLRSSEILGSIIPFFLKYSEVLFITA